MTYRLLVIDDDPDQRTLLRHAFGRSDVFEVVAQAGTAQDAVAEAIRTSPDLILLDLMLAGEDGLELLPVLRDRCPDSRIVVLSGLPREEFEFAVRAGGAVGYLEKGISPLDLPEAVLTLAGFLDVVSEAMERATASLERDPGSPGTARRFVAEVLRRWGCEDVLDVVELAVSELVTNALVHGRSAVDITVTLGSEDVRVDVRDRGSGMPRLRIPDRYDDSGRGLFLVQSLTTSWGVDEGPGWKSVWFVVPRPGNTG